MGMDHLAGADKDIAQHTADKVQNGIVHIGSPSGRAPLEILHRHRDNRQQRNGQPEPAQRPEQGGQQHPHRRHNDHIPQKIEDAHMAAGVAVIADIVADGVEGLQVDVAAPATIHMEQAAEKQQHRQNGQVVNQKYPQRPSQIAPPGLAPGQLPQAQGHPDPRHQYGDHRHRHLGP